MIRRMKLSKEVRFYVIGLIYTSTVYKVIGPDLVVSDR